METFSPLPFPQENGAGEETAAPCGELHQVMAAWHKTPKGLAPEALARRRKAPEPAPQAPRRGAAEGRRRPASMLRRKTFFRIFP